VHGRPTPLLGGIAVYLAFAITILVFLRPALHEQTTLLLAGAAVFALIGLIDDVRNAGAWKLAVESAVVVAIVWLGGFRVALPWPVSGEILAVLWIVGVANAVNCLDCTDGVTAGMATIGGLALTLVAVLAHRWAVAAAAVAVAGAALGFLRYNFPPARIFLGDAGSLMVGFLLAGLSATIAIPRSSPAELVAPVLILAIPTCDFLLVHLMRYRNGMKNPLTIVTSTGKDHLPHRLLGAGLSHRQVAWWLYGATIMLGLSAVILVLWGPLTAAIVMASFVVSAVVGGWGTGGASLGRSGYRMAMVSGTPLGAVPRGSSEDADGVTRR